MTLEELKQLKKESGWTNQMIADRSGVPLSTVQKIFSGATDAPRYATLQALEAAFYTETVPAYQTAQKRPGEFTLEDYYALPDDQRVELIDGTFYVMETPKVVHQGLGGEVFIQLRDYIRKTGRKCVPFLAPVDVQLDCDNRTMVEPDVLVLCDRSKLIRRCIYGAPDLVMEILSPSTRKKDCSLKLHKYCNAGVREYWIIYPEERKVVVYDFENNSPPQIFGFDAQIPVGIFHGDCVIDFHEICEAIDFMFDLPENGPDEE